MTKLTDEIKNLIVTQLAQFRGYAEVARLVTHETGVAVDRFQVRTYDPTNPAFAGGDKWRAIFDRVREHYLTAVESVPIANKAYRLNELQRNYDDARGKGNLVLANQTLEQAAKEVGGAHTNERNLNLNGPYSQYADMTSEERRAAAAEILRAALSSNGPPH
jgi:hypothetical protein